MEESRDPVLIRLDELSRTVRDLERRTAALERAALHPPAEPEMAAEAAPLMAISPGGEAALDQASNLVPLVGWALMGIAGAYLLRALTESGGLPGAAGAAAGILYAGWWLFLAARRSGEKPVCSTVHGLTAALILTPMLWEMTVRFHLISAVAASAVLVAFAVFGLAVAWRGQRTAIGWIVTLAALVTATALFRETHDLAVWSITLLAIAAAVEISACRDHWLGLRWIVALAANLSVYLLGTMATRGVASALILPSPGLALAVHIALLTIYLASTVDRTILRGLNITGFEIGQAAAAFVISVGGALRVAGASPAGPLSVGLFCGLGGVACYLVSFAFLDKRHKRDRNFFTYSTFALALVTVGWWVLLSGAALVAAWALLAVAAMCGGFRKERDTLRIHGAVYLLLAVVESRLLPLATEQVIRTRTDARIGVSPGYLLAWLAAGLCYVAIVRFGERDKPNWTDSAEALLAAALLVWGAAGLAAQTLSIWISAAAPLRTALLTAMAIGVCWSGARWRRAELTRLSYPMMALAGVKLVAEDFRQGQSLALFLSLILFGGGLILLPRLGTKAR